ncbi:MAG: hypothetical protein IGQ88_08290 [Gloeomargaritaceae cyanobacterium C42_A2020_066]|nr:hypothetical protein [Gloeomargaritaceae cyanobacterium C42_A2020_066]
METLLVGALLVVYAGGGWKFWTGFGRTTYSGGRPLLTLLWPLLLTTRSFRDNFGRAMKG